MSTLRDAEKFVPRLLERLRKARAVAKTENEVVERFFEMVENELQRMDFLPNVKHWEQTLLNKLNALDRGLDKIILGTESSDEAIQGALFRMYKYVREIRALVVPLKHFKSHSESELLDFSKSESKSPSGGQGHAKQKLMSREWLQLGLGNAVYDSPAMVDIRRNYYQRLESLELKLCFLSFSVFPAYSQIKKRPLIYWWIGESFIASTADKTAEEVGEEIFEKLLTQDFILPTYVNEFRPLVKTCSVHPLIHHILTSLAEEASLFNFDPVRWPRIPSINVAGDSICRRACITNFGNPIPDLAKGAGCGENLATVFNVNEQYLSLKPEWFTKLNKVRVLQLGRWQSSPQYHIEVDDEGMFLKAFGKSHHLNINNYLKYLSLRGISVISQLPSCIFNITSLEILDLRACHNLETLPADISSLKKLTHFDISECYLLESMPKGLHKLSSLQVLKGFLIGTLQNTPCRLGDFAKLEKLKRLSIHMGNEAVVQGGEFNALKEISSLRRLKISWGVVVPKLKAKIAFQSLDFSFPPDLEKLDLQGIPLAQVPVWLNPRKLQNLKRLYIRGGELDSLDHGDTEYKWKVEILRLKYLKNLKIGFPKLKEEFPNLRYLEKIKCHLIVKDESHESGVRKEEEYDQDIVWSEAGGPSVECCSTSTVL